MNKILVCAKNILCIGCLLFIASCGDDGVEVVSQDTSWTMDKRYIEEDVREELGLNPYVDLVYFSYYNTPLREIKANYDLEHITVDGGNDFSFKVKITKPFKEDLNLKLAADPDAKFPVNVEGYAKVTDENCVFGTVVLKAGESEATIKFSFKEVDKLKELPGSVLALTLKIDNPSKTVALSKSRSTLFLKVNTAIQLANIEAGNEPVEGDVFNDNVTLESDRNLTNLPRLKDGSISTSWWSTSSKNNYLTIRFPAAETLKGIKINTYPSPTSDYGLKSVKVIIDRGDGQWVNNGIYNSGNISGVAYIKFKSPVKCAGIRLEEFESVTGKTTVGIDEINFIR